MIDKENLDFYLYKDFENPADNYFDFIATRDSFTDSDKLKARIMLQPHHVRLELQQFFNSYREYGDENEGESCLSIFAKFCEIYNFPKVLKILHRRVDDEFNDFGGCFDDCYLTFKICDCEIVVFETANRDYFLKTIKAYRDKVSFKCCWELTDNCSLTGIDATKEFFKECEMLLKK